MPGSKSPLLEALRRLAPQHCEDRPSPILHRAALLLNVGAVLSVVMIALVWLSIWYHLEQVQEQARTAAIQNSGNLARAFEENISRAIKSADQTLLNIREAYERERDYFYLPAWAQNNYFLKDLVLQLSLSDKNGDMIATNLGTISEHVNLSDREHFLYQKNATDDRLFISKPVLGRASGKWSIQLSRRLRAADGSFDGIVVASLDPAYLSAFYDSIDVGKFGFVTLVGEDGIVRARAAVGDRTIGQSLVGGALLEAYAKSPAGHYVTLSPIDGILRIASYRAVAGLPLIVSVGLAQEEVFAEYRRDRDASIAVGAGLTILLLITAAVSSYRDNRLRRMRQELRASELQYRSVVQSVDDIIFQTNAAGSWSFLNRAWTAVTGFSVEESIGASCFDHVHPGDRGQLSAHFDRLTAGKEDHFRQQFRHATKDGDWRWLEIYAAPVLDRSGAVVGTSGTFVDITERHAAEEALRASQASLIEKSTLLEATLENMSQGIVMIDAENRVPVINRRAFDLLQLGEDFMARRPKFEEILRHQWRKHAFVKDGQGPSINLDDFIADRNIMDRPQHYELIRSDGVVIEARSVPLPEGGAVRTFTDITERKRAEVALAEARDAAESAVRARSEFLAMMSHEIRTPMNGVIGMADLLQGSGLQGEEAHYAKALHDSAEHLLQIINDILDFSKLDASRLELEEVQFDPNDVVRSTIDIIALHAAEKGLELTASIDPTVPRRLVGDPGRLRQILLNLASNAVKFTDAGSVAITVRPVGSVTDATVALFFEVRDTGIGIAPESIGKLFQDFSQVDSSISRRFGGTGLGLAICQKLVNRMGGTISVTSEPGRGSSFRFEASFRRGYEGAPETSVSPSLVTTNPEAWRNIRILLAEDNETNRLVAVTMLKRIGCPVDVVENGLAALEAVRTGAYDLVLMDVMMPEMDGFAATRAIRALPGPQSAIPIIALTANAYRHNVEACRAAGMSDFLAKPYTRDKLSSVLARYLKAADGVPGPAAAPMAEQERKQSTDLAFDPRAIAVLSEDIGAEATASIFAQFASETRKRIERMRKYLIDGNHAEFGLEAHSLKGSARSFGFMHLASLAEALEAAAADSVAAIPRAALDRLAAAYDAGYAKVPKEFFAAA